MPQPTPYNRQANFTDHSVQSPTAPQSGVSLDAEFNAIIVTIAGLLANLALIQRDDGKLKNSVVGIEQMNAAVLALIGADGDVTAGAWAPTTSYVAGKSWVTNGTGTYLCAITHTSSAIFSTDLTAGRWVLIYDTAGAIPADDSVTATKIADGAVTAVKLGITALDLTGNISGRGGISAGTASVGELFAVKAALNDVLGRIERTTKAQGGVGLLFGGGSDGINWSLLQQANQNEFMLQYGPTGAAYTIWYANQLLNHDGAIRATGDATPATGTGIRMRFASGAGYVDSYSHSIAAWSDAHFRGKDVYLAASGVTVLKATSTAVHFPKTATIGDGVDEIGFRGVPQNAQSAAYTLALTDQGKHIYSANGAGQTITLPANATVAFPIGATIAIVNNGSNPITLSVASGVTLKQAGTTSTGNRTIAVNGLVTLLKVATDTWFVSGAGVT